MAPTLLYAVAMVAGSFIILATLPFLLTAICLYITDLWRCTRNSKSYQEWNRLRKEWNKKVAIERRRRFIMCLILNNQTKKQGLSQEDRFFYAELV
jgi:uncharacterized membrane protein YbaN (DUF454 family)